MIVADPLGDLKAVGGSVAPNGDGGFTARLRLPDGAEVVVEGNSIARVAIVAMAAMAMKNKGLAESSK